MSSDTSSKSTAVPNSRLIVDSNAVECVVNGGALLPNECTINTCRGRSPSRAPRAGRRPRQKQRAEQNRQGPDKARHVGPSSRQHCDHHTESRSLREPKADGLRRASNTSQSAGSAWESQEFHSLTGRRTVYGLVILPHLTVHWHRPYSTSVRCQPCPTCCSNSSWSFWNCCSNSAREARTDEMRCASSAQCGSNASIVERL